MAGSQSEWRRYPMLPIAAAIGYATSSMHVYGLGALIEPVSRSFGWSRTQVTMGLTVAILGQTIFAIPIGATVDRMGSRKLGLLGILVLPAAYALLGTATGTLLNWYLLWGLLAVAALFVQSSIWSSAVVSRFTVARGSALAVSLCGASLSSAIFPWLNARLIASYGWQLALPIQSALWVLLAFPIMFFFFRGARDAKITSRHQPIGLSATAEGVGLREGLRSSIFLRLVLICLMYSFAGISLVVHFIPIQTGGGIDRVEAAQYAAIIGLVSIAGRLITGVLIDRMPASWIGAVAFLLPPTGCLLLLGLGISPATVVIAAILLGLTLGAEVDVIVYLATRHFGLKNFGALYGAISIALALGSAGGPLAAARLFDLLGDYTRFLWVASALMIVSSILITSLPQPPALRPREEEEREEQDVIAAATLTR